MQDKEGGTYTPDTHEDDDSIGAPRPRGGSAAAEKTPLTLIISGIVLVLLLLLVVIFYNSKLSNSNRLPPELGADVNGFKEKVVDAKPIKEDDLLDNVAGGESATKIAPAPETPSSVAPSSESASASSTAPVVNGTSSPEVAKALTPGATPPALKPATSAPQPQPAPPPVQVAKPAPVPIKPAPTPVVQKPAPAPVAATPKPAAGTYAVQIGAFGTAEIANAQFAATQSQLGGAAAGSAKSIEKVEVNGKTFYRTAFAGFATKDKAAALCAKIKAAGKTCFVK